MNSQLYLIIYLHISSPHRPFLPSSSLSFSPSFLARPLLSDSLPEELKPEALTLSLLTAALLKETPVSARWLTGFLCGSASSREAGGVKSHFTASLGVFSVLWLLWKLVKNTKKCDKKNPQGGKRGDLLVSGELKKTGVVDVKFKFWEWKIAATVLFVRFHSWRILFLSPQNDKISVTAEKQNFTIKFSLLFSCQGRNTKLKSSNKDSEMKIDREIFLSHKKSSCFVVEVQTCFLVPTGKKKQHLSCEAFLTTGEEGFFLTRWQKYWTHTRQNQSSTNECLSKWSWSVWTLIFCFRPSHSLKSGIMHFKQVRK